jgi:hypothetical protein
MEFFNNHPRQLVVIKYPVALLLNKMRQNMRIQL